MDLSEEHLSIRDWARQIARTTIAPELSKHSRQYIEPQLLKDLSRQGLMSMTVPEELGGGGLDFRAYCLVLGELSKVCASTCISVAVTNMIADALVREGNSYHHQNFLGPLCRGEAMTASFCLTENASGSDPASLQTKAEKKGSRYRIRGEKIYVTNGAYSGVYLVLAKTSPDQGFRGIAAFLLRGDEKGVVRGKEEDKMGLTASSTIRMSFDDVEVPEENRLGDEGEGFKIAMRALDGGRLSVASQALGTAKAALEQGLRYSKERQQFGQSLADFQAIQWKLADAATELEAAELLIHKAAYLKEQKKAFTKEASMAKLFTTEMAKRLCNEMIQIHGGYGYITEYPVERYYRDARVTSLYEGTSEIQHLVIARQLFEEGVL